MLLLLTKKLPNAELKMAAAWGKKRNINGFIHIMLLQNTHKINYEKKNVYIFFLHCESKIYKMAQHAWKL